MTCETHQLKAHILTHFFQSRSVQKILKILREIHFQISRSEAPLVDRLRFKSTRGHQQGHLQNYTRMPVADWSFFSSKNETMIWQAIFKFGVIFLKKSLNQARSKKSV